MKLRMLLIYSSATALLLALVLVFGPVPRASAETYSGHAFDDAGDALSLFDAPFVYTHTPFSYPAQVAAFEPIISVVAELPPGAIGLPGDPITWTITVINSGTAPGTAVMISDTLRDELRVDRVQTDRGEYAISEQVVVFTIPALHPGESVQMRIHTTLLHSPPNGVLVNQVLLSANGPFSTITDSAITEVFTPTGLPSTGYPPLDDLPGEGEPSVFVVGLVAFGMVAMTAYVVWRRGQ